MTSAVEGALVRAEQALADGRGLKGTGFWKAVDACRRDRVLANQHADRIGAIDRRAFERGVRLRVPAALGLLVLIAGTALGIIAVLAAAKAAGARPVPGDAVLRLHTGPEVYRWPHFVTVAFLVGFGALIIGTHSLTHWIVGRLVGIRFTHVFLGGPPPPRPGVKTDYASYLRSTPMRRAAMHGSGAVVTKIVPFALLPVTLPIYAEWPYLTWVVSLVGVVQIVTDVTLSTKISDWMKVRRELRAARGVS